LVEYYRAYFYQQTGEPKKARLAARRAEAAKPDYCFPARLDEIAILRSAIGLQKRDASARFYLGNLLYDRKRYDEAIALWEESGRLRPKFATVWRNLGIAYFNVRRRPDLARKAYDKACAIDRNDGRLVYERDQLWKRLGEAPARRLKQIGQSMELVMQRDDATIELCALYNQVGRPELAVSLLAKRRFQPWEGGEGLALGQYVRTHLALARKALEEGRAQVAVSHCEQALNPTENLGEARHLLANQSDLFLTLGDALAAAGQLADAREAWRRAASFTGDFQEMKVRAYSEMSYFSAQAMQRLGDRKGATKLLRALHRYAVELEDSPARIDYFATSLPTMLLFNDDIQERQRTVALFLRAQAELGLGRKVPAKRLLKQVIARDPSHAGAADLLAAL
jgi:tetratricopeptide (TPR) repeat protein